MSTLSYLYSRLSNLSKSSAVISILPLSPFAVGVLITRSLDGIRYNLYSLGKIRYVKYQSGDRCDDALPLNFVLSYALVNVLLWPMTAIACFVGLMVAEGKYTVFTRLIYFVLGE